LKAKVSYRLRNWRAYNKALVNRGNITLWFSEDSIQSWRARNSVRRGRPFSYSDSCIELALSLRSLFGLPLRGSQGFLKSFIALLKVELPVPDYSTLSRRASRLKIIFNTKKSITDIVVDSTGLKIYGEGEWKTRVHGKSKRRTWRKLHIAMDADSFEVVSMELTPSNTHDDIQMKKLLTPIATAKTVYADGAYISSGCFDAIAKIGAKAKIPIRTGTCKVDSKKASTGELLRNELIDEIRQAGGKTDWKKSSDYHKRSLVETEMFRFKQILGNKLQNRNFGNQIVEAQIKAKLLNKMTRLGMPDSYKIMK
jgi:hypothetical protein